MREVSPADRSEWQTPELVELSVAATRVGVTSVNSDLTFPATELGSIPIN